MVRTNPGGPGRAGGLLFAGVLLFLAYLALTGLTGADRLLVTALLAGATAWLLRNVRRRR